MKKATLYVVKKNIEGKEILFVPLNERFNTASFDQKNELWHESDLHPSFIPNFQFS